MRRLRLARDVPAIGMLVPILSVLREGVSMRLINAIAEYIEARAELVREEAATLGLERMAGKG